MKSISVIGLILMAALILSSNVANAATLSAGTLIKASGPAVYYYSDTGKRLVFPTEKTFKTWFSDFSNVTTVTDAELAAIPLGGNVTYKPGVKLVKITTDPSVYAVAAGGVLRHIASESLAVSLYGPDWNTKVDDVPDAFFTNYNVGSEITSTSDFSPSAITALATSIDADKLARTTGQTTDNQNTNTTTTTPTAPIVTLTSNKSPLHLNDLVTISATASYATGIRQISLFFDGQLLNTCNYTTICNVDYHMPAYYQKDSFEASVTVQTIDLKTASKVLDLPFASATQAASEASIKVDRSTINPGQSTGITVTAAETVNVKNITIYVDTSTVKGCDYLGRTCQWSQVYNGNIGKTFNVYGIITDTSGRAYRTTDETITLAANDSPAVTVLTSKPWIYVGETVDVTVSGADDNGIQSNIVSDAQKAVLKTCSGASPCTYSAGPWSQTGTYTFYGKATDLLGASDERSVTVEVRNN
ncbi:MAG: hypothetical protein PHS79_04565 [Patescibacteria group bacterium]|nr:hypothetical protein [Patescibacteria group bacterium]